LVKRKILKEKRFPISKMGLIFGILNSASEIIGSIGFVIFGFTLQFGVHFNWRIIFYISGGIMIFIMFATYLPLKVHPSEVGTF
jgi:sugar phosphate permease